MNIGKAMQELREETGLSRRELAEKLACTPTSLWKIENNRVSPKKSTIDKFCAVCGIPPAYLYTKALEKEDFLPDWATKPLLVIPEERLSLGQDPLPAVTYTD